MTKATTTEMHPGDKKLFRTYANDVGRVATDIANSGEATKDEVWRQACRKWAEDLHFVTMDLHDTIDRL